MMKKSFLRLYSVESFSLKLSTFNPHELSRVVLRAVRENKDDLSFWKSVVARANAIADQFQPYDISVIAYGLGRMRYRDKDLLTKLAARAIPSLSSMSLSDISHLLAGFARVDVRNDLLFDLASREIGKKINTCKSLVEISNIIFSFVSLNYEHPLLFSALGKRAMFLLPFTQTCASSEICKLVESFARSEIQDDRLFALFSSEICRRIDQMSALGIAGIASAYAKRDLLNKSIFLTELLLDESFKRRSEFDAVSASLLLSAVVDAKAKSKISLIAEYFISDFCRRGVMKFDLVSISLLASALGKYHVNSALTSPTADETKLFMSIGDRVASLSDQLDHQMIAMLVKAFADVGVRHGPFLFNIPNHVREMIGEMSLSEIGMVFKGYAYFGIRNDVLLDHVPPRVLELISSTNQGLLPTKDIFALYTKQMGSDGLKNASSAVDILESLAILMVSDKRLADSLMVYLDGNKSLLSRSELLEKLPQCINTLRPKCPESLLRFIVETSSDIDNSISLSDSARENLEELISQNQQLIVS